MNAPEKMLDLHISRFIRAPREKVYDAFVNPELLAKWKGPRGMSVPEVNVDARPGGKWRLVMVSPEGTRMMVGGVFRELRKPERLVYTWQWEQGVLPGVETLIEVDFVAKDGGTELKMHHSGFPASAAGVRDGHAYGWDSTLNKLNDLLDETGSAATVTLMGHSASTFTWTARLGLTEKGVKHTHRDAFPNSDEVGAIHPFKRIPVFRDGPIELFETSTILRYVDEAFPGPRLTPDTIIDRSRCEQWVSAVSCYFYDTMVRRFVLQYVFPKGEGGKPDRGVIDKAVAEMRPQLAALDKAYGNAQFLAGPTLSFADLFVAPIMAYVDQMPEGKELMAGAPNVARAAALMQARPSFAATRPPRT